MARRGYPPEFRRKVLDLLAAGREVVDVARDLELSDQTIYNWRRQDRIDRGLQPGLTTAEKTELGAANRRIASLRPSWRRRNGRWSCWWTWCPQKTGTGRSGDGH